MNAEVNVMLSTKTRAVPGDKPAGSAFPLAMKLMVFFVVTCVLAVLMIRLL
jgi:hypothetical protein